MEVIHPLIRVRDYFSENLWFVWDNALMTTSHGYGNMVGVSNQLTSSLGLGGGFWFEHVTFRSVNVFSNRELSRKNREMSEIPIFCTINFPPQNVSKLSGCSHGDSASCRLKVFRLFEVWVISLSILTPQRPGYFEDPTLANYRFQTLPLEGRMILRVITVYNINFWITLQMILVILDDLL